jgi:hypothetical protein
VRAARNHEYLDAAARKRRRDKTTDRTCTKNRYAHAPSVRR